ncbi:hypothetical protein CP532_1016 [Ophiocordyceps camponoti-leonardi (nom. inval.)]|nr:hypothetical protein CP532_1016 [Ophiocordyceps camponoti-leonardi (nom. inval.)]
MREETARCERMALFAAGFNAFSQLSLNADATKDEPDDLFCFTQILQGDSIERPVARLSYTLVRLDGHLCMAGIGPEDEDVQEAASLFAEAANGEILVVQRESGLTSSEEAPRKPLFKYASFAAWRAGEVQQTWTPSSAVQTIAAYDTGFVILYQDGTVATLGDARFESCLGRHVTEQSPASEPGIVTDLSDLGEPVKHVSASGYTLAALTESGAMYVWGLPPRGLKRRSGVFSTLERIPNYVEIGNDKDVKDMAVGDCHALALTTDGSIYVTGGNENGQLGLGKPARDGLESWIDIAFQPPSGHRAVAVAAGPRSSFILTAAV